MRIGAVQLLPQRDRSFLGAPGEEHGFRARFGDLGRLAREAGGRGRVEAVVRDHGDPRLFGVGDDDLRERQLERILVVEHV